MLTFFRNIRKSMLYSETTSKYLMYAIGEIALVVIGILIALQINNWNEEVKKHKASKFFYERLLIDINEDITELETKIKRAMRITGNLDELVKALDLKSLSPEKKKTIDNALNYFYRVDDFSSNLTTYEEMISSGKLEYIEDVSLRDDLANYYKDVKGNDIVRERYARNILDHTLIVDKYVRNENDGQRLGPPKYNFNDMANDEYLINLFARDRMRWNNTWLQFEGQREEASNIKSKLENILQKE